MKLTAWRAVAFALLASLHGVAGAAGGAEAAIPVPAFSSHVVDTTSTLDSSRCDALDRKLAAFEARKGPQLAVLIVASTAPETIDAYGMRVADQWKAGRRNIDDGAILLVAINDHAMRIEVGYGLEGALPDAVARRILGEVIEPRFRAGDFAGGLDAGTDAMIAAADSEALPAPGPSSQGTDLHAVQWLVLTALGAGALLRRLLGPRRAAVVVGGLATAAAWWWTGTLLVGALTGLGCAVATLLGLARWWPGGGRGGGDGGGGFGLRGGRFGGGGASTRW